jgi:hypothetical protein
MISALRTVWRLVDTPIFSKIFLSANSHPRRDRNKTVDRIGLPRKDPQKECVAAVDIGESTIAVCLIGEDGRMFFTAECTTLAERGYRSGLYRICKMLREIACVAGIKISCIDIRCIGRVNPFTGTFGDVEFTAWRGTNLVENLLRRFRVPVDFKMTHTPQPSASRGAAHKKKRRD